MKAEAVLVNQQAPDPGLHILGGGVQQLFKGSLTLDAFIEHPKHQSGDQVLFHVMVLFKSTVNENNKNALKYCQLNGKLHMFYNKQSELNMIM